jgi:hypothetical protein
MLSLLMGLFFGERKPKERRNEKRKLLCRRYPLVDHSVGIHLMVGLELSSLGYVHREFRLGETEEQNYTRGREGVRRLIPERALWLNWRYTKLPRIVSKDRLGRGTGEG